MCAGRSDTTETANYDRNVPGERAQASQVHTSMFRHKHKIYEECVIIKLFVQNADCGGERASPEGGEVE